MIKTEFSSSQTLNNPSLLPLLMWEEMKLTGPGNAFLGGPGAQARCGRVPCLFLTAFGPGVEKQGAKTDHLLLFPCTRVFAELLHLIH